MATSENLQFRTGDVVRDFGDCLTDFGLDSFRPGQKSVIENVIEGRDVLCIMPTGGGKSLCYQLPSLARHGTTIVVSPLIALMKDQVDSLIELGIPATLINSSISQAEQQQRIADLQAGLFKLVYIAPERLRSGAFMRSVQNSNIQLLAIDEAHCISQWGHDFRPDYARLGRFRERIGNPQTIALTATATRLVREDIARVLKLIEPQIFVTGFSRENLSLNVTTTSSNSSRDHQLVNFLKQNDGSGIVYASTRKNCEQIVELLKEEIDRPVEFYHAGLTPDRRKAVQESFMLGEIPIVVATNAFGMGIDKADLRFVAHYNLPGSVEAYYQEAGRAGRDGNPANCQLFYAFQDRFVQEFFIENSYPSRKIVEEVYEYLMEFDADPIELTLQEIKENLGLSVGTEAISTCENLLEKAGVLERLDSKQNMAAIRIDSELPTLVELLGRDAKTQRKVLKALERRVGNMRGERIFFAPQQLALDLDMKWDAINRSIRQIAKLDDIDYVPPFRGRALHFLKRGEKFSKLAIDFSELDKRKKAEFEKLESMIRFASTRRCRQLEILEYFGDPDQRVCGTCDNCSTKGTSQSQATVKNADSFACQFAIQVTLSGVARTHGRIGKNLIAQMLTGSSNKKVKGMSLHRLSTFGLLKPLRQSDVVQLIDWLIELGFVRQNEASKFRPVVNITSRGQSLMTGQDLTDCWDQLPAVLIRQITELLAGRKPRFEVGPSRDDGVGVAIKNSETEVINAADDKVSAPEQLQRTDPGHVFSKNSEHYWTWRLFSDGYSVVDIVAARRLKDEKVVFDHLLMAAESNMPCSLDWIISETEQKIICDFTDQHSDLSLALLMTKLPKEISTEKLQYFMKVKQYELTNASKNSQTQAT